MTHIGLSIGTLFEETCFGDLAPADVAQVMDASCFTPYKPQWSPVIPTPRPRSILFGCVWVPYQDKPHQRPQMNSPVSFSAEGCLVVPPEEYLAHRKLVKELAAKAAAQCALPEDASPPTPPESPKIPKLADMAAASETTMETENHESSETPVSDLSPEAPSPVESLVADAADGELVKKTADGQATPDGTATPSDIDIKSADGDALPIPSDTQSFSSESTAAQVPLAIASATMRSWADLVKPLPGAVGMNGVLSRQNVAIKSNGARKSIGEILKGLKVSYKGKLIHPRGLINNGNMCFMNAILQPLVHCPPFYNSLKELGRAFVHNFNAKSSLLGSMLMFLNEFHEDEPGQQLILPDGDDENAFVPEYVYDTLRELKHIDSAKGRQEDAEEFLGFILDGLHEEMLNLEKTSNVHAGNGGSHEADSWSEVGRNNKTLETRSTQVATSPISSIFMGKMRSMVRCPGRKDSVTFQPFQALQLDIAPEAVTTIDDALLNLTTAEILEGFTAPTKGHKGHATKQYFVENLPPILILHLKRFVYDNVKGALKLHKYVTYNNAIKVNPDIMSPAVRGASQYLEYRLFAVVYHHGRYAAGGHYTCDVLRQSGDWLRMDDAHVTTTSPQDVLGEKDDRQAYMLFYCRA
ncbi:hypothetical protein HKX48_007414 [Thoreauomyces humboldtii]|nr:hypothetical protein HKX48_007414 [Thoreauomyces humboldtii]